jgi:AcrR family transcriptional regulator
MTRDDILNAAFSVWGREFYKTTSLAMLAKSLGVSKAALYRHFADKDDLLAAMEKRFFDSYVEALRPAFDEANKTGRWRERLLILVRFFTSYFAQNFNYFIYIMVNKNKRKDPSFNEEEFKKRGLFFAGFLPPFRRQPSVLFLTGITALFETARFHKNRRSLNGDCPSANEIQAFAGTALERVRLGLCFGIPGDNVPGERELTDKIPYKKLETHVVRCFLNRGNQASNSLIRAVAETVAETGPWNASMETVAKKSGLSKSGLYSHFKNKRDMLSRLFMDEFECIAETATLCSAFSERREERLYLAVFSIAEYLRTRPEILTALDWIRIQRLELDLSVPFRLYDFFTGLHVGDSADVSNRALFLLVAVLMRRRTENSPGSFSAAIRKTFRFISLGLEGM